MRAPLPYDDPLAVSLTKEIHSGDVTALRRRFGEDPGLARLRIVQKDGVDHSLVHVATNWPGHFPGVAAVLRCLVEAGADVNARMSPHPKDPGCVETPLHWAASSNDVAAIDALLDLGADIEASGAIFTGGGPLSDAVMFANWEAARRLVERGARPTWWQGAALGRLDLVRAWWEGDPRPARDDLTRGLWHACRGAQRETSAFLLEHGADPHWVGWDRKTPLQCAAESGDAEFAAWLASRVSG